MPSAEILAVLADEVTEAGEAIASALMHLVRAADAAAFDEAKGSYLEQVQRIGATCEALKLSGLRRACAFIEGNMTALGIGEIDAERRVLLDRWPTLVLGYLRAPRDGVYSRELAQSLRRAAWPEPLDEAAADELERSLVDTGEISDADDEPARATEAHPEDVVLKIPDDVNPTLVDAFLTEGPQQAGEYSALIQRIVRGDGWTDELIECRRLIHALKGAANTVGVRGVAMLCHHVEDILEFLVENSTHPEGALARLLIKVADTLEIMFEALLGNGEAPADAQAVLQAVLDAMNRIDRGEYALSGADATHASDEGSASFESIAPPVLPKAAPISANKVEPKVRVATRVIDNLLWTSGEIAISSSHIQERLKHAVAALAELRERQQALWDRASDMESFVTTQGIAAGRRQVLATASGALPAGFDALEMDQYNELHTYVHGITETVADLQLLGARLIDALTTVNTAVGQQALLNDEMHDLLMTSRMVSARNLDSRLQRTVRQAAEQCGKDVSLRIEGADVMLDDQLVNLLIDPLQHLLRNAVDHGVEGPSVREAFGKHKAGEIELRFARDGNYLVVTCRDDGAGLDLARIRAHAAAQGLITEDQELSEDEVARLILRFGFSTADKLTEVSGRGVGMDIVHTSVARLKGTVDIRTQTGLGTTFVLRVPMSLGIVHSLLAVAGRQTFALPTDNLERIVYGGAQHVQSTPDGLSYRDGEIECRAYSLARLVGYAEGDGESSGRHVVLMKSLSGTMAIVVDAVTGGNDLVIKNMGRYLAGVKGVAGASILGDGTVVPILELSELMQSERTPLHRVASTSARATEADVLIVDDSLSVRTALATLLTDAGFRVRLAKDGIEAIEAIGERLPAVVLADLEMPRMNGLELTVHIRTNPATRYLPVIMVTSRTAEKHRSQAKAAGVDDYVTKPYRESDLVVRVRNLLERKAA
jgi:chemotaxis protein histidine kinase CheA/ActR/RegA family two-component response regulator